MSISLLRPVKGVLAKHALLPTVPYARRASTAAIPFSNIEAQWKNMSREEQSDVHRALEQLQKKDWKQLSLDEKKAAYYVAFGPHGPRSPIVPPGSGIKVFFGTVGLLGAAGVVFFTLQQFAGPPPKTVTKEWEEATNEKMREEKINPITGVASEGYKGKGMVQSIL